MNGDVWLQAQKGLSAASLRPFVDSLLCGPIRLRFAAEGRPLAFIEKGLSLHSSSYCYCEVTSNKASSPFSTGIDQQVPLA